MMLSCGVDGASSRKLWLAFAFRGRTHAELRSSCFIPGPHSIGLRNCVCDESHSGCGPIFAIIIITQWHYSEDMDSVHPFYMPGSVGSCIANLTLVCICINLWTVAESGALNSIPRVGPFSHSSGLSSMCSWCLINALYCLVCSSPRATTVGVPEVRYPGCLDHPNRDGRPAIGLRRMGDHVRIH